MTLDIASFFNFSSVATTQGLTAVIASFMIGVLIAGIVKSLFRLGLLIGLLVAVLVVTGVVSISAAGSTSGITLTSIYGLATSIWTFLSGFSKAIIAVFQSGGVDAMLAGIIGFALAWFGIGFIPLRRKD